MTTTKGGGFIDYNKSTCILYVPVGSESKYATTRYWKDFEHIVTPNGETKKIVNVINAGTLSALISNAELDNLSSLTVTGNIDARDFKTMRDKMPLLAVVDLSGATIVAYTGNGGTNGDADITYPGNEIPTLAFNRKYVLTSFEIPSTVTSIAYGAFLGCNKLSSLTIPSSVTSIGELAFKECIELYIVLFQSTSSLTSIAAGAFADCTNLKFIQLPSSLLSIGGGAFSGCKNIYSITIPQFVTSIGSSAFLNCTGLSSLGLLSPSSLKTIETWAFAGCTELTFIYIPSSVTLIEYGAFTGTNAMVNVETTNTFFSSRDGILFNKNQTSLYACTNYKSGSYNIPSSVRSIGQGAFLNCSNLTTITIPPSVTWIGMNAFSGCTNLTSIYANVAIPIDLSSQEGVFYNLDKTSCILYVPAGSENLYEAAEQWKDFTYILPIPGTTKTFSIATPGTLYTFLTTTELGTITNLTLTGTIDARDFKTMRDLMPNLSKLDLGGVNIAEYTGTEGTLGTDNTTYPANEVPRTAFYNNLNLSMVSIPESAKTIGRSAFNNCDGLTQIIFGANSQLTAIGYLSFAYCDMLTEIQIPSNVTLLDYGAFRQCGSLVTCNLPQSVKSIGNSAFYQCYELKNLAVPQAVETIGEYAFYSCKEILNFNIPASTTSIGFGVFNAATGYIVVDENNPSYSSLNGVFYDKNKTLLFYCPPTTSGDFVIPATVSRITVDAFYNCSELTSIDIPDGLITLHDYAFENCTGLTTLSLPQTLASIGNYSFYNCSGLTTLFVNNPIPVDLSLQTGVFFGIDKATCKLFVPAGSESLYATADQWKDFVNIVSINNPPVANAGSNQTVNEGTLVTLDGSASFDENGVDLNYLWNAPAGITLSSKTTVKPTFTAPEVKQDSVVVFTLVVNNGNTNSVADTVAIIIKNTNKAPYANAGPNLSAFEGTMVKLDGSASFDDEGDKLSYLWTVPSEIMLNSNTIVNPTFIAPEVKHDTVLIIYLVVNDGNLNSNTVSVRVTIKNVNKMPIANAGTDQAVTEGVLVTLNGSASFDDQENMLTYLWTAPAGISLSSIPVAKPTFTAPNVKNDSVLVFTLLVNDGSQNSLADSVLITVQNENKAPVANAGPDKTVLEGIMFSLNGSLSYDDDGDNLSFLWTAPEGITLSSEFEANPTFTTPEVENNTVLEFKLVVNDGKINSVAASVKITIKKQLASISLKTLFGTAEAIPGQVIYKLFREIEGKFTNVDISEIQEGNTTQFNVEPGNWLVMALPDLQITDFVPTYLGNCIDWGSAQIITLQNEDNFSGTIICKPLVQKNEGNYTIAGFVYETSGNKNAVITTEQLSGDPLPGVLVLLYTEEENTPFKTTITDNAGKYSFENLPSANYHIKVEIPGFTQTETWNIKVEGTQEEINKVNFTVITNLGVITDVEDFVSDVKAYPNPTRGVVNIVSENPDKNSHVDVYSSAGVLVLKKEITNSYFQVDLGDKTEGLYILSITSGDKTENIKIILKK